MVRKKGKGIGLSFHETIDELEKEGKIKTEIKKPLKPAEMEKDYMYMEIEKIY